MVVGLFRNFELGQTVRQRHDEIEKQREARIKIAAGLRLIYRRHRKGDKDCPCGGCVGSFKYYINRLRQRGAA